jgi:hypothetical protein
MEIEKTGRFFYIDSESSPKSEAATMPLSIFLG